MAILGCASLLSVGASSLMALAIVACAVLLKK